jgi:3-oxoadipate enol-lactonase
VGDRFDLDAVADAVADEAASRVRAAVESAVACDLRPMLAGVGAPLALLRGDRDRVVSAAAMRTLTETRPDALVATIHDCGHVPQLERPPAFLAAVERLLVGLRKS